MEITKLIENSCMKYDIDIIDYILIGCGLLLLPVFGLGLIPIGAGIYRIGDKMEKYKKETDEELKKYDIDYIDENVLRELK